MFILTNQTAIKRLSLEVRRIKSKLRKLNISFSNSRRSHEEQEATRVSRNLDLGARAINI